MVFQNYALYPHMTVLENMVRPEAAKTPQGRDERGEEAAKILDSSGSRPQAGELSGGQRQRVAMGRAIVREPERVPDGRAAVEPRRQAPRADADRNLADPAQLEMTTIYVTHDQTEAMTLGDRVAVMRAGILQQVGPPRSSTGTRATCSWPGSSGRRR